MVFNTRMSVRVCFPVRVVCRVCVCVSAFI